MKVVSLDSDVFFELPYLSAASRGGAESRSLPFQRAVVEQLPEGLSLLLLADLQGTAPSWRDGGAAALLGESLSEELPGLSLAGELPSLEEVGVILAGDLFAAPDAAKRGATGDVRVVWRTLRDRARWVAGVAGNHDLFGSDRERERFSAEPGIHLLDGAVIELGGLRIGGVGGISGDPTRQGRRELSDQLERVASVLAQRPDLVVLHEGPDDALERKRGRPELRELFESHLPTVVVCGHSPWSAPLSELRNGTQVINVCERALLLTQRTK